MDRKFTRAVVVVVFLVFGVFSFMPSSFAADEGFSPIPLIKGIESLKPGDDAPTFVVKDLDGELFDFAKEIGKNSFMLVFWSIYCEPCREEMPLIEKISNQYKENGLVVLAVNMDGDPFYDAVKGFIQMSKYTFKVLMDELEEENFKIADPYNVAGTPVVYIVDKKGTISFTKVGRVTERELVEQVSKVIETP